jgi:hypothetical protein
MLVWVFKEADSKKFPGETPMRELRMGIRVAGREGRCNTGRSE